MPCFDFDRIAADMEMEQEDVLHLMSIYRPELQRDFQTLKAALEKREWKRVKEVLHKMKGDAANLCLSPLSALFLQMEHAAQAQDAPALTAGLTEAQQLSGTLWGAFQAYEQNCK